MAEVQQRYDSILGKLLNLVVWFHKVGADASGGNKVVSNLAAYVWELLKCYSDWSKQDVNFLAWVTRSQFEINIWIRFVLASGENLKRFAAEQVPDTREVFSCLDLGMRTYLSPEFQKWLEEEAAESKLLLKSNPEFRNRLDLCQIAHEQGQGEEWDAFYTLYSKLLHPTAWLLGGLAVKCDITSLKLCLTTKGLE